MSVPGEDVEREALKLYHHTLACTALLAALAAPITAWAGVRVMVDSACARKGQAATLASAVEARLSPRALDGARLYVEPMGRECRARIELEGERRDLGSVDLEDAASVRALASLTGWVLEPGGELTTRVATARAADYTRSARALARRSAAEAYARGESARTLAQAIAQARVEGAVERADRRMFAALEPGDEIVEPARVEWLTGVGARASWASLNGDGAGLLGIEVNAMRWSFFELGVRAEANVTQVSSRYAFRILEDDSESTQRPELATAFAEANACARAPLGGSGLSVFASAGGGFARVERVSDDEELTRTAWAPSANASVGTAWAVGPARVEASVGYRLVGGVDWIGPQAGALSSPAAGLVVMMKR